MPKAVLVIEDEEVLAKNMCAFLERHGYDVRQAASAEDGFAQLEDFHPDAVVLDFNLPGLNGLEAMRRMQAMKLDVPVIMVTGHGSIEMAVDSMKAGAFDFLTKPVSLNQLRARIERALDESRLDSTLQYYQSRESQGTALEGLLGESAPMRALKQTLVQLLEAESQMRDAEPPAVLVLGETGTGKEVVARALHFNGARRDKPFVELNCAALPAQLLESELFGHERGAFTDARERKLGLVETAEGGTLFLDEIGDMDLAIQAKLLKLLEEKTVRRLGNVREQRVNVRIIAATHRPLDVLVREGRFRADLYYRLCVVQLMLPPLRERGEDMVLLARHFLRQHAARYGKAVPVLSSRAHAALLNHAWPGNVRELRNVLEQAVLLNNGNSIELPQLAAAAGGAAQPSGFAHSGPGAGSGFVPSMPAPLGSPEGTLQEVERRTLSTALERNGWNVTRAARELGISRDTLRYRMEKHGLQSMARMAFSDSQR
jgi:two-component system, NtrC family, response regulator AtoC